MQRDEENDKAYDYNYSFIDVILDLLDDINEWKPLMALNYDFSDLILGLGEDNKKTDASSSRIGEGETKLKHPEANQMANEVPGQNQMFVERPAQNYAYQPYGQPNLGDAAFPVMYNQHPHFGPVDNQLSHYTPAWYHDQRYQYQYPRVNQMIPGESFVGQNYFNQYQQFGMMQNAPPYAPGHGQNQHLGMYQQNPPYAPGNGQNQQMQYSQQQHDFGMTQQVPPYAPQYGQNQQNQQHQDFGRIQYAPPYALWLNQQMHDLQLQTQQPTQSQRLNAGSSSHQCQDQPSPR